MWQQIFGNLGEGWGRQGGGIPALLLHTAAVAGWLPTLLWWVQKTPRSRLHAERYVQAGYGLAFGLCAVLFIALATQTPDLLTSRWPLCVSGDLVFLAGLLGGWLGGGIGLSGVALAGLLFGEFGGAGLWASSVMAFAGASMHRWLERRPARHLGHRTLLAVWLAALLAGLCAAVWPAWMDRMSVSRLSADPFFLRLAYAPLSFVVLGGVLLLRRHEAREQAQAGTEPLTGLPNRRALHACLDGLLAQAPDAPNTLITLEIDNLGDMVRLHGHAWPDDFWRQFVPMLCTHRLAAPLMPYQPAAFMFSDLVLAIVLKGVSIETVQRSGLAEAFFNDLAEHLRSTRPGLVAPRLRMGVAMASLPAAGGPRGEFEGGSGPAVSILRDLHLALQGDSRSLRYFYRSFAEKAELDEQLREMLIGWIGAGRAPLHFQPKCQLHTGEIIGAEALLRALDVRGGEVAPAHMLEVAARNHLLVEFEWCTIETVVQAIDRCLRAGRPTPLAVNVSAASIAVPGFGQRLLALLRERGTPCRMLAVEITENSPVPDIDTVADSLLALHAAGVRLSLDDFGTGYSALSMLARFPFNEVKIDHAMVARLEQPRMRAAVSLAYESARRYSATLVAEGVETRQQLDTLLELGVTRGQGYFFAPAMPIEDLLASERFMPFDLTQPDRAQALA
ncbi:hypothetical protein RD110_05760 [Rhodoferax koreense]|uniref:EAL domain-containing protein n=1 Tax=Rhodoferax koreensis TaxID=1842727 RepID=A0A1P8JSQ0_9BURK|nr:GGDEF domain-containing phosphodiesterase [Rhodoferax koreense]APW36758.1 hypothetical protein RD110_05760 [Rhodoferax koreense]